MTQEGGDFERDFPVYPWDLSLTGNMELFVLNLSSDLDSDLEDNLMCFST